MQRRASVTLMPQGSCVSATIRRSNASEYFSALIFLVSRARVRQKKLRGVDRTPQPFGGLRDEAEAKQRDHENRTESRAEPEVRIQFPPADSPSLSRSHFRASRTRAFPAGVRGSLDDGVSRDAAGFPLRANRRQCLCPAIFQYRSEADAVSGNATTVRTKSGVSGL